MPKRVKSVVLTSGLIKKQSNLPNQSMEQVDYG